MWQKKTPMRFGVFTTKNCNNFIIKQLLFTLGYMSIQRLTPPPPPSTPRNQYIYIYTSRVNLENFQTISPNITNFVGGRKILAEGADESLLRHKTLQMFC